MITYRIITDLEEAKMLWNEISDHKEIYDEWDFRYVYWQFTKPELRFIAGYDGKKLIGLLPLQLNTTNTYLEFFGGSFMSYNALFIKSGYEEYKSEFLKQLPLPAKLLYMKTPINHPKLVVSEKSTYYLPLTGLTDIEDYFSKSWGGSNKGRIEVRRQMRKLDSEGIKVIKNRFSDLPLLVEYNKERFGQSSVFHMPYREEFFAQLTQVYPCFMLSFEIEGKTEAVAFRLLWNGTLYGFNAGLHSGNKNLGKYMYLKTIGLGIELGASTFDAMEGEYGWKENFGFLPRPQYHLDLTK